MADVPLWVSLVAPSATLAVGAVAATFAALSIRTTREVARHRATLDYIESYESTDFYQKIRQTYISLRSSPTGFETIYDPQTEQDKTCRQHIVSFLNHYEMLSLGIQYGTISEEIYYQAFRGAVVSDWNALEPFIRHRRTVAVPGRPPSHRAFVEFEWLARRWANTEIMPGIADVRRNRLSTSHYTRAR
jgi:acetoin utilization deacetylase AcuC-like enzyme